MTMVVGYDPNSNNIQVFEFDPLSLNADNVQGW